MEIGTINPSKPIYSLSRLHMSYLLEIMLLVEGSVFRVGNTYRHTEHI